MSQNFWCFLPDHFPIFVGLQDPGDSPSRTQCLRPRSRNPQDNGRVSSGNSCCRYPKPSASHSMSLFHCCFKSLIWTYEHSASWMVYKLKILLRFTSFSYVFHVPGPRAKGSGAPQKSTKALGSSGTWTAAGLAPGRPKGGPSDTERKEDIPVIKPY